GRERSWDAARRSRRCRAKAQPDGGGLLREGCLTMTYFRMGNPHSHRRAAVSRSCSGWEGVVPAGYGRQALRGNRTQATGDRYAGDCGGRALRADATSVLLLSLLEGKVGLSRIGAVRWNRVLFPVT